jgi:hypothetical protein
VKLLGCATITFFWLIPHAAMHSNAAVTFQQTPHKGMVSLYTQYK